WFDEPVTDRHQYVFGYHRDSVTAGSPTTVINLWPTHRLPVLLFNIGGAKAREIETWREARTESWIMMILRDVFGDGATRPRRLAVTRWNGDPFSRGAYSFMALGASPQDV